MLIYCLLLEAVSVSLRFQSHTDNYGCQVQYWSSATPTTLSVCVQFPKHAIQAAHCSWSGNLRFLGRKFYKRERTATKWHSKCAACKRQLWPISSEISSRWLQAKKWRYVDYVGPICIHIKGRSRWTEPKIKFARLASYKKLEYKDKAYNLCAFSSTRWLQKSL